ncbi:MAG TPA: Gfo/Idh/MocA family oxidoreductase [Polyangiaceae bacterium]
MTNPLRVGIVGGGFGQHVHVPAFRVGGRATVEAICTTTVDRASAIAKRLEIPRALGDWRELVADRQLDAVAISVPPSLQAEIAIAAATSGKHVFAEKPLALTAADAQRMSDSIRRAGVVGIVDFEFREIAGWQRLKGLLEEGAIGPLRHVHLSWRVETLANREGRLSWKRDANSGGGTLNLFGSHALDSVLWAFGDVRRLSARTWSPAPEIADTQVEVWLETVRGLPISISLAADAPQGSGYRVEIYGTDGSIVLENRTADYATGFTLTLALRGERVTEVALERPTAGLDGRIAATAGVVRRFLDAIETRSRATPDFDDGLSVQRLMDAIRESENSGLWQHLTWPERSSAADGD